MRIFWSLGPVQTPNFLWAEPIRIKQAFLIDRDVELFMYLTQCIRFGYENLSVWTGPYYTLLR